MGTSYLVYKTHKHGEIETINAYFSRGRIPDGIAFRLPHPRAGTGTLLFPPSRPRCFQRENHQAANSTATYAMPCLLDGQGRRNKKTERQGKKGGERRRGWKRRRGEKSVWLPQSFLAIPASAESSRDNKISTVPAKKDAAARFPVHFEPHGRLSGKHCPGPGRHEICSMTS